MQLNGISATLETGNTRVLWITKGRRFGLAIGIEDKECRSSSIVAKVAVLVFVAHVHDDGRAGLGVRDIVGPLRRWRLVVVALG